MKWSILGALVLFVALHAFGMYLNHGKNDESGESVQAGANAQQAGNTGDAQISAPQQAGSQEPKDSQPDDLAASVANLAANADVAASVSASTQDSASSSTVAPVGSAAEATGQAAPAAPVSASTASVGAAAVSPDRTPVSQPAATPASGGAAVSAVPGQQTSTMNQVAISGAFEKRCGWIKNELPTTLTLTDRDGAWSIVSATAHADGVDKVPAYGNGVSCGCIIAGSNRRTMTVTRILTGTPLPVATCQRDRNLQSVSAAIPQHVYTPPPGPPNQYTYVKLPDGRVVRALPTGYWPRGYTPHN